MSANLSEEIKWRYYCTTAEYVEQLKLKDMILSRKSVSDGYEIILNVVGSKKEDVYVNAKPDGELSVNVRANDYFTERTLRFQVDKFLDSSKAKAKIERVLLVINIPYKDSMHDVQIRVD
jgi:HSP20 family molecular chaperone IbpA